MGTIRQNCYKILCKYHISKIIKRVTILQRLNVRTLSKKIITRNYCVSSIIKTEHKNYPFFFYQWLVGFTDGDGTFTLDRLENGKKWVIVFKISQKSNNGQLLYYIKNM